MNEQWQELKETIIEMRDNDGTGTQQEVCKFLANLMDVLEKQMTDGWISVSEKLPKDRELILFSTKTDRVFVGSYFKNNINRQWYSFFDAAFAWNNVVTAWMPLPEPYVPDTNDGNKAESEDKE